jgi:ligand-binding sensor domain-containing protein
MKPVACFTASLLLLVASEAAAAAKRPHLPPAVARAIQENRPKAVIDKLTVEKEGGVVFYDIEFKANQGEMDVAEDGTVMDVATIVRMEDIPAPAAAAIRKAAEGAKITQLSKSEVRAEVKDGRVVKLAPYRYVYEAEMTKGKLAAEIQVSPDGAVVEGPNWEKAGKK